MASPRDRRARMLYVAGMLGLCVLLVTATPEAATSSGQEIERLYYYSGGKKVPLRVSTESIAVRFNEFASLAQRQAIVESRTEFGAFESRVEDEGYGITCLPLKGGLTSGAVGAAIRFLESRAEVAFSGPVFELPEGLMVLTDEMSVQFQADATDDEINALNLDYGVEVVKKLSRRREWYLLRLKNPQGMRCLDVANAYHENPLTVFSLPRFMLHVQAAAAVTPDDTYFDEQWPLQNTGQDPPAGKDNADINAPEGWETSTGSPDIVIAIIDTGVDLTHEDLENVLVDGYDTDENDCDPNPEMTYTEDAHGTACAGLAAAETDNSKGIAGVAWGCKIMPIRIAHVINALGEWSTDNVKFGAGIQWASDNGADILSNSWGLTTDYDDVHEAIEDAKTNGRGGKGCVIVACSHNQGGSVLYPAKYDEVIAVGATDHHDVRWDYSNFGPELDVMAPSGSGELQQPDVIMWSTDISGEAGYNDGDELKGDAAGDYTKWMGGTSGATPEVAGLAALILSMNPDFTSNEVQYIIESTADDLGDGGRDDLYGWGRINVDSALTWVSGLSMEEQLKHWWKLDETSGTTAVDSVGDADGTLTNMDPGTDWVAGWIDGALDFDGENDYVNLGVIDALKGRVVTISAWIYPTDTDRAYSPIVTQYYYQNLENHGYYLCLQGEYPAFYVDDSAGPSDYVAEEGEWHHIAGTYDSQRVKIYVDGLLEATFDYDADDRHRSADANIGHDNATQNNWFEGIIDDVRIYSWAMDVDEILDKMYYGTSKFAILNESGVRVAWFDDRGNLFLKGSLTQGGGLSRPSATADDEFIIEDSTGNLAIINTATGDMQIYGSAQETWEDPDAGEGEFIIHDDEANPVAYIDESGNLYLKGELYKQAE